MGIALLILKIIVGIGTVLSGLCALIAPKSVYGFTGLRTEDGRGITEIRAILGAFFIGLGGFVLIIRESNTWIMLGVAYLVVALVRFIFMFIDKSVVRSNIISLVVELIFGVILVL
ncbi:MAG: hypothetical protein MUO40_10105 [Anaerolineaceae bacterium]|nr:hypothetical protein [Anaerolineaceae bacterium]